MTKARYRSLARVSCRVGERRAGQWIEAGIDAGLLDQVTEPGVVLSRDDPQRQVRQLWQRHGWFGGEWVSGRQRDGKRLVPHWQQFDAGDGTGVAHERGVQPAGPNLFHPARRRWPRPAVPAPPERVATFRTGSRRAVRQGALAGAQAEVAAPPAAISAATCRVLSAADKTLRASGSSRSPAAVSRIRRDVRSNSCTPSSRSSRRGPAG